MSEKEIGKKIPRRRRQLMGKGSVPVQYSKNPDSRSHAGKFSFGIGDMVQMGEIQEPINEQEHELHKRLTDLQLKLGEDAIARVREQGGSTRDNDAVSEMWNRILEEEPERKHKIDELKSTISDLVCQRYGFGTSDKYDLFVGKEGTLIYSVVPGLRAAGELEKAWVRPEGKSWYEEDLSWRPKTEELSKRLRESRRVADIHQIEVLPEYRGKGYAKALLDVAMFDIEWTNRDIEFSIARVEKSNPHREQMIDIFRKAGFLEFCTSEIGWGDIDKEYSLLIRENPRVKKKS
ncbi:MAG: GNAT family N-acetyltransferase [Candidatus Kerfeldbacteria bacterium]